MLVDDEVHLLEQGVERLVIIGVRRHFKQKVEHSCAKIQNVHTRTTTRAERPRRRQEAESS